MEFVILEKLSKNAQIPNFIKIRSVGAELFGMDRQTDGRTDMKLKRIQLLQGFR
jgi:hypothetical protein